MVIKLDETPRLTCELSLQLEGQLYRQTADTTVLLKHLLQMMTSFRLQHQGSELNMWNTSVFLSAFWMVYPVISVLPLSLGGVHSRAALKPQTSTSFMLAGGPGSSKQAKYCNQAKFKSEGNFSPYMALQTIYLCCNARTHYNRQQLTTLSSMVLAKGATVRGVIYADKCVGFLAPWVTGPSHRVCNKSSCPPFTCLTESKQRQLGLTHYLKSDGGFVF